MSLAEVMGKINQQSAMYGGLLRAIDPQKPAVYRSNITARIKTHGPMHKGKRK
jgi:hypothetical protein